MPYGEIVYGNEADVTLQPTHRCLFGVCVYMDVYFDREAPWPDGYFQVYGPSSRGSERLGGVPNI